MYKKKAEKIILISVALVVLWSIRSLFVPILLTPLSYDETINPEITSYYQLENVDDRSNAAIGLAGISAPQGEDVFLYGRRLIDAEEKKFRECLINNKHCDENTVAMTANELHFQPENIDLSAFSCWLGQEDKDQSLGKNSVCMLPEVLRDTIQKNELLLDRYHQTLSLPRYYETSLFGSVSSNLLLLLSHLDIARISLLSQEGKLDEAMKDWETSYRFYRQASSDYHGLIRQAVFNIIISTHLMNLPRIIHTPEDARRYKNTLIELLDYEPFGEKGLDALKVHITDMHQKLDLLAEQHDGVSFKSNMTKNRYFSIAKDIAQWTKLPTSQFLDQLPSLHDKYYSESFLSEQKNAREIYCDVIGGWILGVDQPCNFVGNTMLPVEHLSGMETFYLVQLLYAYRKMILLYIDSLSQGIRPEDMNFWLAKSPDTLRNPLSGYPFQWDENEKYIFFDYPHVTAFPEIAGQKKIYYGTPVQ